MTDETRDVLESWSTDELLHAAAFDLNQYTAEAHEILLQLLRVRGVDAAAIAEHRARGLKQMTLLAVCEACGEELLLNRREIVAGEFLCPTCGERHFVEYPRITRYSATEELPTDEESDSEDEETDSDADNLTATDEAAESPVAAECQDCHKNLDPAEVYSHFGRLYCADCYKLAVVRIQSPPVEDDLEPEMRDEDEEELDLEASEEQTQEIELADSESLTTEDEADPQTRQQPDENSFAFASKSMSTAVAAPEPATSPRIGIRGGLLVIMLNLILVFVMQSVELIVLPIYQYDTMRWFAIGHLTTVGFLIYQLAARKKSFKLNFLLYLGMICLLLLVLTVLNPTVSPGTRVEDYPLQELMRYITMLIVWAFYFAKSDRPQLTLIN